MGIFNRSGDDDDSGAVWYLECDSDPRWVRRGPACGMWDAAYKAEQAVKELTELYGNPPADLKHGYSKP